MHAAGSVYCLLAGSGSVYNNVFERGRPPLSRDHVVCYDAIQVVL